MRRSFVVLGVLLLAGCAHFEPKPLLPEKTAADFEQRSLANPGLHAFIAQNSKNSPSVWPPARWDFDWLTLAAFYYQPSLEVARADWRAAQAGNVTAAGRLNPTLSVGAGYDSGIVNNFSVWTPAITLDVPIETAGKRQRRIDQAGFLAEASRFELAGAAWQVRSQVRSSLVDFDAARRRVEVLEQQADLRKQIDARLQQELAAGAVARAELNAAAVARAKTAADLGDAQRQLAEARVRVAAAIGIPAAALEGITIQFDPAQTPAMEALTSAEARNIALRSRTDILGALAEYAASQSALQLEIAKQYPDFHLTPGYLFNQGNEGDSQWQLGLTVELPVLNRNQGPIAEAKAHRDATAARFLALQAKVIGDIDRVVAVYHAAEPALEAQRALAAAEKSHYDNVAGQFRAGAVESLDLLDAQAQFNDATLNELDAESKLQQAVGDLEDAIQQPVDLIRPSLFETSPLSVREKQP